MLKGLWCEAPSRPKNAARRCSKEWPEPQIRQGGYSTICPFPGSLGGGLSGWFSDNDYPIWNGNSTIFLILLAGSVAAAARCYNLAWGWAMNGWVSGIIVTSRFCPVGSPFCSISDCSWMALRPRTWWASNFLSLLWPNITPCYVNFNVYGPPQVLCHIWMAAAHWFISICPTQGLVDRLPWQVSGHQAEFNFWGSSMALGWSWWILV